jgi:hypothetical protein
MNKPLLALAALPLFAAPAAAQYGQTSVDARGGAGIENRLVQLETRLDAGIRQGEIDEREARNLRRQLWQLRRTHSMYSRDGLDRQERADLRMRLRTMRQDLRIADRGTYDRYEQYSAYDDDPYDDRDPYDGRTGYYGQGGPVEGDGWVVDETGGRTTGIPGLIGNLFGVGSLQVGQRATGNLYAVPYEYRDQFRDTPYVYFRSDGSRIYEIDARTQTVLRIYRREAD